MFAIVDQGSCFAGTLAELALAADRSYMLLLPRTNTGCACNRAVGNELRRLPMVNRVSRIANRFCGEPQPVEDARGVIGDRLPRRGARAWLGDLRSR